MEASPIPSPVEVEPWQLGTVTLVAVEMRLRDAVLEIARQAGVSAVAPNSDATVTVELTNVAAEEAFRRVGQLVGLGVTYRDGLVSFGEQTNDAEVFAILDPGFIASNEAVEAFQVALGNDGNVKPVGGRIAYGGSREGLRKALEVAQGFRTGPDGWLLRVVVFEVSDRIERELGIDIEIGLSTEAQLGDAIGQAFSPALSGARAAAAVAALATLAESGTESRIRTTGTLYLLEGEPARLNQGDSIPIPRRTVSPEGNVETAGFDYIDTGFTLEAEGRRVPTGLQLELQPTLSNVAGFVEEAPIFTQRSVEGTVIINSGEWVVLSGLSRLESSVSSEGLPGLPSSRFSNFDRDSISDTSIVIAVQAERVTRGYRDVEIYQPGSDQERDPGDGLLDRPIDSPLTPHVLGEVAPIAS